MLSVHWGRTVWAAPHSVSRVFEDRSDSHSSPYAHGHHPIRPVETTLCWPGEGTEDRAPRPPKLSRTRLRRTDRGLRGYRRSDAWASGPWVPTWAHTWCRCLLQARVPCMVGPQKTGSHPCILRACVYIPPAPQVPRLRCLPRHPTGTSLTASCGASAHSAA